MRKVDKVDLGLAEKTLAGLFGGFEPVLVCRLGGALLWIAHQADPG